MTAIATRPVSVAELQRAYRATVAGAYRTHPTPTGAQRWDHPGPVLPVVGACAGAGSTTVALAIATAAGTSTVLECSGSATSGLAAAATAELGPDAAGWARGTRGTVALARPAGTVRGPGEVPVPAQGEGPKPVILDVTWDPGAVLAGTGWLAALLRRPGPVVVVAPATIPGLRRLELTLHQLGHALPIVALVGPRRRDRAVTTALDAVTASLHLTADRVVPVPWDVRLATRGVDSTPLPPRLLHAADRLLHPALAGRTTP